MPISLSRNLNSSRRRGGVSAVAFAFGLTAIASSLPMITAAHATDLDFSQTSGAESEDNNFLRLGLNKSAVIKLPAPIKDVIVGNPGIVDVVIRNRNTAYLFGRAADQTNVFFFDANGQEVLHLDLEVTMDGKGVKKLIDRAVPGNNIKVDTTKNKVILSGTANNAAEAKLIQDLASQAAQGPDNVVNAMSIGEGDQVMLKVKVVEVKRDVLKTLGIDLNAAFSIGNLSAAFATGNPVLASSAFAGANFTNGDFSVEGTVDAMESQGLVRMLAEPTLTAISGQRAQFIAGGQYPYISGIDCDNNGRNCVRTVTYKDYGVKLGFTPEVLSEGRINLKIATEVSELSDVTTGALSVRAAETTVELPSGGAMMLAGLIKDTSAQQINGTPGLKELPILGTLFRSRNYTAGQTELAVIVSPYIVNAVSERDLATPADRLHDPSDSSQVLWGRLNRVYGTAGKNPNGVYHGSVGYIIE